MPRPEEEKGRHWFEWALAWGATAAALGILFGLLRLGEHPLLLPSFGGSCVILFGMPESVMARPRSLIGGHVVGSAIGIAFGQMFGSADWVMVGAVATSLVVMQMTKTVHSPAGADPIIAVAGGASWSFLVQPIALGLAVLLVASLLFNALRRSRINGKGGLSARASANQMTTRTES
jgi:CBS-domain-containing membrane protein